MIGLFSVAPDAKRQKIGRLVIVFLSISVMGMKVLA
jgi:hypothetical protein